MGGMLGWHVLMTVLRTKGVRAAMKRSPNGMSGRLSCSCW